MRNRSVSPRSIMSARRKMSESNNGKSRNAKSKNTKSGSAVRNRSVSPERLVSARRRMSESVNSKNERNEKNESARSENARLVTKKSRIVENDVSGELIAAIGSVHDRLRRRMYRLG